MEVAETIWASLFLFKNSAKRIFQLRTGVSCTEIAADAEGLSEPDRKRKKEEAARERHKKQRACDRKSASQAAGLVDGRGPRGCCKSASKPFRQRPGFLNGQLK